MSSSPGSARRSTTPAIAVDTTAIAKLRRDRRSIQAPTRRRLYPSLGRAKRSVRTPAGWVERAFRRLVADDLGSERALHALQLGSHFVLELGGLLLEPVHPRAHLLQLLLELEDLLDAGEVD